ncbi:hypothetical protein JZ751_009387 [Albula glossodonta]|uniref:Uncharacterized protein n=1 Tax=Albula glossodonta TaxID=121402 RepID=A0A8T2N1D6_9TELE|nr:hypothetical protein JZ751_009387 [Albula glossodonta]
METRPHSQQVLRLSVGMYDKQGFLLKLDGKLFVKTAPMFLDKNFKRLGKVNIYLPPFGFKTQERIIDVILTATKNYGLSPELESLSCRRCIVIGNGGILTNKSLGSHIDEYDIIVRSRAPSAFTVSLLCCV